MSRTKQHDYLYIVIYVQITYVGSLHVQKLFHPIWFLLFFLLQLRAYTLSPVECSQYHLQQLF